MSFTKQPIGFRRVPTSDPEEQRLRDLCYCSADEHGHGSTEHQRAQKILADYIWARTEHIIAEDRRKHPKAKRNAPKGSALPSDKTNGPMEVPHIEGFTE